MRIKKLGFLFIPILVAAALAALSLSLTEITATAVATIPDAQPAPNPGKISVELNQYLQTAASDEPVRFIIHLNEEPDIPASAVTKSEIDRRAAIIDSWQQTAEKSQMALHHQLLSWQGQGQVATIRPFWIINAIAVQGNVEIVSQIAARSDVATISLDRPHRFFDPPLDSLNLETAVQATHSTTGTTSWGVKRVQAPTVWNGLGVTGEGVTVAIMDSGVDWLHPDLYPNYRGNLGGGSYDHSSSWFHTSSPAITEPIDFLGHGTHVAGSAVGQNGIGVAPGAQWIAVSIADENGFIYESDVHAGFQWLMAPGGDPALAPDIINNSWSGSPYTTNFVADIEMLQAAGIITVFAAGNSGPFAETIGSPASYTNTISVAATDDLDTTAWFSSRGPSPLTNEQNPWIAAPGTEILSALPDSSYGTMNGTSMATPHVVGAIALLLSANPGLTRSEIATILADTAVANEPPHPNDDSGWGRLDTYAAVSSQVVSGLLTGVVQNDVEPLPDAAIVITNSVGSAISVLTDENGRYQAALSPGLYALQASYFGYAKYGVTGLAITVSQTTTHPINLNPLPGGVIDGVVRQAGTNSPLAAAISVLDTPIMIETDEDGRYTLNLPAGAYKLVVQADGHHLGRASILVQADQTMSQDFYLETSASILLVDSGQWYFDSYVEFYQSSLAALNRNHDTWTIRDPYTDVPTLSNLESYDTVIWSNPADSPGYLGAGNVISDYLGLGGNLLISGQHVGSYDGQGFDTQYWWYQLLGADFMGKTAVTATLTGADETDFAGMRLALNEDGSAGNQTGPDQSRPRANTLTAATFSFPDGLAGGLQAGQCRPYRIAYFGFGLEGVAPYERADILTRSLDFLESPRRESGAQWEPEAVTDFALAGDQLVYTLTIRNMSETMTDTLRLAISETNWPSTLLTKTVSLGPCQTGQTVLTIDVPETAPEDWEHQIIVTAFSANDSSIAEPMILNHKTPGNFLLVDDDRWYNQEDVYKGMLEALGVNFDVWEIGWDNNVRGSPPAAILQAYDFVIWFTGYDWFAPVTAVENEALTQYLAGGGRLLLTSQDFMHYHHQTTLARNYLNAIEYRESVTPTHIFGAGNPILPPALAGPLPLSYPPFQNFSDGVIPGANSDPFIWSDKGLAGGIATIGADWRAVFLSFPLEKLPPDAGDGVMNSSIGWLSDLGESTFEVDRRTTAVGEPRTFTITLRNLVAAPANQVTMTNTLPARLTIIPGTISGAADYDPATRQLTWSGLLTGGESHQISYQAQPSNGPTSDGQLENHLQIYIGRHDLSFERVATVWLDAPDLSGSRLTAVTNAPAPIQRITYTLQLINNGSQTADDASSVLQFSEPLTPDISSLAASGGIVSISENQLNWQGDIDSGGRVTITVTVERPTSLTRRWLPATAVIQDNITAPILLYNQLFLAPYTHYFPLIYKPD